MFLILLSGFFSGAEVALVSVDRLEAKRFVNENLKNSKILLKLKENQRRTLVTLLVGNNIVNILGSSLAAALAIDFFGDLGIGIATFFMTLFILIFGEVIPKTYCSRNYRKVVLSIAPIVSFLCKILRPIVSFFDLFARLITKNTKPVPILTEKELKGFFEVGLQEKVLEPHEKTMFEKVLKFNDVLIGNIMIPFNKVVFVNGDMTVLEAAKMIGDEKYTRYPVFKNRKKNVVGIVRGVDILTIMSEGNVTKKIKDMDWPVVFVNEDELIDDVFRKFKRNKVHMGVVKNSKNKIVGIVTMEDIIEEIVGEFGSEDDNIAQ
ncbi:MAG: hemolysin family protein [Candidatus Micrarchaeota archaeon]